MIVEILAVGTELLLGQIVNGNAAAIGAALAEHGFDANYQQVVGDNRERVAAALRVAAERADAVVITGGIGPTQDDLTREAMCTVGGREMTRDQEHANWIEARVGAQTGSVNPTVLRMADLPAGAEGLPNLNGVALGVAMEHRGKWMFAVPGVPVEMMAMLDREVIPRLHRVAGDATVLRSRVLRTWGMGESRVGEALDDLFASTNPSVAFLISDMEVKVRITAKGPDVTSAERLITPLEKEIRSRLGEAVFGADEETVETLVVRALARHGWTVGTVEEATLGQIAARLAATEGLAPFFGGSVTPGAGTAEPSPVVDVLLRVGRIGETETEDRRTTRPVEMTVATPHRLHTRVFDFGGDDERVRSFATIAGLHMIRIGLEAESDRT